MIQSNKLKTSLMYSFVFQFFNLILPFLTTPYISRVLGVENIGIYSYTSSIAGVFMLFAALGTSAYGAREIARFRKDRAIYSQLFWEIESLALLISVVVLGGWGIFILNAPQIYVYYFIALTPMIISTTFDISWLFNGLELIKYNALRQILFKTLGVILFFVFVKTKEDLIVYTIINAVILLLSNLSAWTYLKTLVDHPSIKWKNVVAHVRNNIVYFIPAMATSFYTLIDKTLIGLMTQDTIQSGYYEQTGKITTIIIALIVNSINVVVGARTTFLFAENKYEEARVITDKSLNFTILFSLGAIFGLCGIARDFVPLFLGGGYEGVVEYIYYYSPIIFFIGISNCLGSQYYTPIGLRTLSTKVIILAASINFILNILFIPAWGSIGAIVSTIVAEGLIAVLYVFLSKGYVQYVTILTYTWKRLLSAGVMLIVLMLMGNLVPFVFINMIIKISVGSIVYMLLLIILKDAFVWQGIDWLKDKLNQ